MARIGPGCFLGREHTGAPAGARRSFVPGPDEPSEVRATAAVGRSGRALGRAAEILRDLGAGTAVNSDGSSTRGRWSAEEREIDGSREGGVAGVIAVEVVPRVQVGADTGRIGGVTPSSVEIEYPVERVARSNP